MTKRELAIMTLARFPALCPCELALFLFPTGSCQQASAKAQTSRLLAGLRQEAVVVAHRVNGRELAYSLTKNGKLVAIELGVENVSGRTIFETPSDWAHDRFTAALLAVLSNGNAENYVTEHQLAAIGTTGRGFPDGLIKLKNRWCVLEVEHTRKTGPHMRRQLGRIEGAALTGEWWGGVWVTGAVVAYPNNLAGINHRTRIVNALHETTLASLGQKAPLVLVGFGIKPKNPSSMQLFHEVDGRMVLALTQERGLPSRVETGQRIGPRQQYQRYELEVVQPDPASASCSYRLRNVLVALDANEEHRIVESELWFGGDLVARVELGGVDPETAIQGTLRYLNRLPRDQEGNILPPANVSHDVLCTVFSAG